MVTAYFNVGRFPKGSTSTIYGADIYERWMLTLSLVRNPMIIFVDNAVDQCYAKMIRNRLPSNRTRIVKVSQSEMWSFRLVPRIAAIFTQRGYPKHLPNTVEPRYSAAMHAKYEVMHQATTENPFRTRYFSWLDVGLFRDLITGVDVIDDNTTLALVGQFSLELPPGFLNDSISFCEITERIDSSNASEIVRLNLVWVGGGFFVGKTEVMRRWTTEYMNGVQKMFALGQMSTDQQVIYFILNCLRPRTTIQTYRGDERYSAWFHLAYVSGRLLVTASASIHLHGMVSLLARMGLQYFIINIWKH